MNRIPIAGPWITQREIDYVNDAVTNGWYEQAGSYVGRFEAAFAAHVGRPHAVSLPSCTSGLHLALLARGIGPGDEVIVPETTWIASAAPVHYVGATPIFADIDPDHWCMSAASFRAAITPRTKAVIPVDLYGSLGDIAGIEAIAREHGIFVIEDAAQAIGARAHDRRAGSFGDCSTFSFHGTKTLTTGEGGMLVTSDPALFERVLFLRDHGRAPGGKLFWNTEVAYKYRMGNLQAALGLAQLERIEELIARKRQIFGWYREELAGLPGIQLNCEPAGTLNTYWMVTIIPDPNAAPIKEELMAHFAREGIDTRPFFYPLSSLPAYAEATDAAGARKRNRVAIEKSVTGVNLPSALALTREQVARVCSVLRTALPGLSK